eukprot:1149403-Pelagomonas_calceolata.AAC.1
MGATDQLLSAAKERNVSCSAAHSTRNYDNLAALTKVLLGLHAESQGRWLAGWLWSRIAKLVADVSEAADTASHTPLTLQGCQAVLLGK